MNPRTAEDTVVRLRQLSGAGLELSSLIDEAGRLIERAIPYDGACWHTMDPATLIETSFHTVRMPAHGRGAAEIEYLLPDYNKYSELARSTRFSGVLSEATEGVLDRSRRYRDLMKDAGLRGELRVVFVADGLCWGCVAFFRSDPNDFSAEERDLAHRFAELLGRAFRGTLIIEPNDHSPHSQLPGMILFDGAGRIESSTAEARSWLDQVAGGHDHDRTIPHALLTVVASARSRDADVMARVAGRSGQWVSLHASPASGGDPGRIAVILQGASPVSIAPLIAAAHGFTEREREVTELVLQGFSTAEIAARLYISPLTVQVHLKTIFAKAAVRSRRELVGRIFVRHYQPTVLDTRPTPAET